MTRRLDVDILPKSNYCNHKLYQRKKTVNQKNDRGDCMKTQVPSRIAKLISIGNSKGIRLPKMLLQKYDFGDTLLLEETEDGVLIRKIHDNKLSWEQTYQEMAAEKEKWLTDDPEFIRDREEIGAKSETL